MISNQPICLSYVYQAEENQSTYRNKFDKLSETGKGELTEFKGRRVSAFRKNLIELGELQVKHSKVREIHSNLCCLFFFVNYFMFFSVVYVILCLILY